MNPFIVHAALGAQDLFPTTLAALYLGGFRCGLLLDQTCLLNLSCPPCNPPLSILFFAKLLFWTAVTLPGGLRCGLLLQSILQSELLPPTLQPSIMNWPIGGTRRGLLHVRTVLTDLPGLQSSIANGRACKVYSGGIEPGNVQRKACVIASAQLAP